MSRHAWLILLLLVILAHPAAAEVIRTSSDQAVSGGELLDQGYDFRLDAPGPAWQLLGESEIRAMAPDAVAGVLGPGPLFGLIIVEKAPALAVNQLAETVMGALELEQSETLVHEAVMFRGEEAIRFRVRGVQQGFLCELDYTVFAHQGHAYQLVLFGAPDVMSDAGAVEAYRGSFSFLGGPVRGRATVRDVPDFMGVGWRTRDGRFDSAAYGIAVDPTGPWHVAVGTELAQMNADAEVGLVAADPEAFVVLIPEQAVGVDQEQFARRLLDETVASLAATRFPEDFEATVGGRPLTFAMLDVVAPFPSEMMHAVHFEGDTCFQVLAWYYPTEREAGRDALREAFEMIRFLTPSERTALKKDLRSTPEPTQQVGPNWCLRDGTYSDFEYGFGWQAPGSDFWRIRAGQDARLTNSDAQLYLEEPSHGLFGVVIAEVLDDSKGAAFHQLVLDNMEGTVLGKRRKVRVAGGTGFTSRLDLSFDGLQLRYHVTTYTTGDRGIQLVLWGLPTNVDAADDVIAAAIEGMVLHRDGLPAVTERGTRYADHRTGWEFTLPGDEWTCRSIGDYRMAALGSQVTCTDGEAEAMVVSVQAAHVGQDEKWMEQYAEQLFTRLLAGTADGEMFEEAGLLAGHESHRLSWSGGPLDLSFEHIVQRQTLYGLLITGPGHRADELRALRDGFELLP